MIVMHNKDVSGLESPVDDDRWNCDHHEITPR